MVALEVTILFLVKAFTKCSFFTYKQKKRISDNSNDPVEKTTEQKQNI